MHNCFRPWFLLLLLAALPSNAELPGQPAPDWDALFQNQAGWIGADGNYSLPLAKGKTLWLFSDTFVGQVTDGKRVGARMVNNSIALQQGTNRPEFFYGVGKDGQPASFIRPKDGRGYFWLMHGARTEGGLWLFLHQIVTVRPKDPFGFKLVDCWLGQVTNPDDPPPRWHIRQTKLPFAEFSPKGSLVFGGAVMLQDEFLYVFGGDSRPEAKKAGAERGMVIGRVPAKYTGDFKQWQFYAGGSWQKDFRKVTPVFPNVASEFSVSWLEARRQYAAVYTEGIWGRVVLRLAPALEGPWSKPVHVYQSPEMKWAPKVFSYAAKAHPELTAAPDELLITYAANSWNFSDLINDARLYWPRFIRVKVESER